MMMHRALPFIAALALAAPAMAQQAQLTWTKVKTPDGAATVEMPCAEKAIQIDRQDNGGFNMTCQVGPHVFNVASGLRSTGDETEGKVNGFEYLYDMAANSPLKDAVVLGKLGSRRMATIGCKAEHGPMCIVLIDRGKQPPLALAYSGSDQDFFALSAAEQARASQIIARFAASVKMAD